MEFITKSEKETYDLAYKIASELGEKTIYESSSEYNVKNDLDAILEFKN